MKAVYYTSSLGGVCLPFITLLLIILFSVGGFSGCKKNGVSPADTPLDSLPARETYHADNDIAMTLMSVTDAIRQGEDLDSADYAYHGILTDGMGSPLYTDIHGSPGEWEIKVDSPSSISISNLYLGDLLPEALESYISQSLGISINNKEDSISFMAPDDAQVSVYDFPGGTLRFETRVALTPAGQEGPLMTITASANP